MQDSVWLLTAARCCISRCVGAIAAVEVAALLGFLDASSDAKVVFANPAEGSSTLQGAIMKNEGFKTPWVQARHRNNSAFAGGEPVLTLVGVS